MTVMFVVPLPTTAVFYSFRNRTELTKGFRATRTSRSPTLPSSHSAQITLPMPRVLFMRFPSTVPPIDLKWIELQPGFLRGSHWCAQSSRQPRAGRCDRIPQALLSASVGSDPDGLNIKAQLSWALVKYGKATRTAGNELPATRDVLWQMRKAQAEIDGGRSL